jgi:4-amino-4-deoxy-L-arabinose transferase-like glycosyltransferase
VYLWRITPFTLFGLVLAVLSLAFPRLLPVERDRRRLMLALLLFSLLFTLFMSLGAKKFDRYLLPIFAPLNVVAALGWLALDRPSRRYARRIFGAYYRVAFVLLMGAVLLGQLLSVFQTYPYYLNFYNPMLGGVRKAAQVMMVGWGEGLNQAARYLNALPRTNKERAIAWYGDGCFSYFFDGATVPIGLDFTLADLRGTDFVVLYLNQWQRGLPSADFMAYFEQLKPIYVVSINGVDYVRVYNLREVP